MLVKFAVKNYRGFADRIEMDLSNSCSNPSETFSVEERVIKNGILYGSNGSGKTNLGLSIFDIVSHLSYKWVKTDYYNNYLYAGSKDKTVNFEYTFRFGRQEVFYTYTKDGQGRLTEEKLMVDSLFVFVKEKGYFMIDSEQFPIQSQVLESLKSNANQVSIVNFLLSTFPLSDTHYLIKLRNFVSSMLWFSCLDTTDFMGLHTTVPDFDEYIINHDLLPDFHDFLLHISKQNFAFVIPKPGDKQLLCEIGENCLSFQQIASRGSSSLQQLYFWTKHIDNASFVFIDDFDAFYSNNTSYEVLKLLIKFDCQVFVSTRNDSLMKDDLLLPDCYFIVDENKILRKG